MAYKFTDIYETPEQQHADDLAGDVSWGDYATALAAGSTDVVGAIPALTRWMGESMPDDSLFGQMLSNRGRYHERKLNETAEDLTSSMSDSAQARSLATIGSSDFLSHPFSSLALKTTRTAPSIAASIGATLFTAGGAPSMAAIAAISGGLSAGETLNEMYSAVDSMGDKDLRKSSTIYDGYRKRGLSEDQSRKELDRAMIGYKPFGLFALGAVTGVVGPAGQIAGVLGKAGLPKAATEVAKRGVLKRVGAEALQGGASEFVQTGAEQLSQEKAAVDVGLQPDIRWGTVASAAAEGGLIGGILGGPTGLKSHTNANPRPEKDNPPAVVVENAVKPNQASVPARGSNTAASPAVTPAVTTRTGAVSRAATVPGAKGDVFKKSKQAPGPTRRPSTGEVGAAGTPAAATATTPATPATGALAGLTPNTYAQVAPQGAQGDPKGLVAGPTEVAALNTQVAPTVIPEAPRPPAPTPVPAPAPAPAVSTDVTPAGNVAPPVPPTAAAPAPAPAPQVPARTTPGGGLGAGTPAVVQGRPSAFGGVEQPVTPAPASAAASAAAGPRVLQVAPTKANAVEIARQNAAREAAAAADAKAETDAAATAVEAEAKKNVHYSMVGVEPFKGKQKSRNNKVLDDSVIARRLLDDRPTNPAVPTTEEGINALKSELGAIVESAVKQGADLRGQVGHVTTPHSLVWLREAQELVSYLNGKKPKLPEKQAAVARFIDRETRIRIGEGVAVKAERALEAEQAMAARGKGKGQVTEQTQESDAAAASTAKKPISVEGPTETKKLARKAEKGGGTITVEVPKAVEVKPEEDVEELSTKAQDIVSKVKAKAAEQAAKEAAKVAEAKARGEKARAAIEARTAEENRKAAEAKKAEAEKPKPEPAKKIEAIKEQAAEKKAAQEAKLPPKVKRRKLVTKEAPKPSAPAAFAEKVKEEVEPNPSDAQILADNASKAHVNIEGMPLAIETAANTERQIITPTGSRIGRLYKYAYGHILGTKAPDGNPIDIFLGPEAYPDNPKLDGLRVVVIDQVDPDTKAPDEPKVMYGFETVKDAVAAYEDSYPRGSERRGDVTPMTPNEFKQWRISKQEVKNAQEPAGAPVSELEALIAEQTEDAALDEDVDIPSEPAVRRVSMKAWLAGGGRDTPRQTMNRRVEAYQERSAENEKIAAAFATRSDTVANYLDDSVEAVRSTDWLDKISKALFPRFSKRIRELAGDVQVYVVPDDIFQSQMGQPANTGAFYSMGNDYIVVRESEAKNDVNFAGLVLHEATHAAFVKAVYSNPKMMSQLNRILSEAIVGSSWADVNAYGLTNIDELMAEAFSNREFQEFLLNTKASEPLIKELGLDGKFKSMWDVLVRYVAKALGFPRAHDSLFSAVMKVSAKLELDVPNLAGPASRTAIKNYITQRDADIGIYEPAFRIRERLHENLPARVKKVLGTDIEQQEQAGSPWLMTLRSLDQLIQAAKKYGLQFYEHLRKVGDTIERIRTTAEKYLDEMTPLINESHGLERKYKGTDLWKRFVNLVHAETRLQVYADRDLSSQKHLGKNTLRGAQPKAEWRELNTEFKALEAAAPDLIAFRTKAMDFYKISQNKERLGIIRNVLKITGFDDPAMAQRLFDGDETEDDIALLKQTYDHIKGASELAKLKGPYFPQMRRGQHVVRALFKIVAPKYALRALPDANGEVRTWEFAGKNARNQALDFAAAQKGTGMVATPVSVWVDKNTGERYFNLGKPDEIRVRPEDADAEQRFRVTVQNRFVEFYETKRQARQVAAALRNDPAVDTSTVAPVVEKRFNSGDRQAGLMSHQLGILADSLAKRPGYQNLSDNEKNQVVQAFNTASLRLLSSTRIQTKRMQRTNVLGASDDFTRNLTEYSQSVSSYLAMLDHQNDLNTAMVAARKEADSFSDYNKSGGQSSIMNVIEKRVKDATAFDSSGRAYEWGNRLLALSFASKLISPATNLLNSLQVAMVSYPALAARFGAGRAAQMLFKVYREIGTAKVIKQGIVASKRAIVQGPNAEMPTMVEDIISRISSPQVRAMLRYLIEVGSIDANAGIEISDMIETRTGALGTLDHYTNYIHTFGRQMPKAIEAINRTVTAIASYNLEMQRSGDHDKAVRFAQETTNMTQGLYSHTNAAPIFNHPLGRLSLQFKKYGQLMYGMLGHNIGKAIMAAEPGDRAEALKTLGYLLGTHFVMAGALGLPQEPLKWLIIGARAAGADVSWAGFEHGEREFLSSILGQKLGEIAARGITRALPESFSFDLSGRAGMQDLLTFGEPRSADKQDLSAFFWDTAAGAPAQMLGDWMKGSQAALRGDIGEAAQRFSIVKVVTDAIKSYRNTSGEQKTAAGYEKLSAYGLGETAIRAFGFTPAREAETSEARNYYAQATKAASAARDDLMHQWFDASPSDRGRLWGTVERFNYGKVKDERLTRAELDRYAKRRRTEERTGLVKSGFRVTRRDTETYKKLGNTYNISP